MNVNYTACFFQNDLLALKCDGQFSWSMFCAIWGDDKTYTINKHVTNMSILILIIIYLVDVVQHA